MPVRDHDNPFSPGRGGLPPYLAGREFHQDTLGYYLRLTANKRPPGRDAVLIGPRGNGKTVLLNWFKREAVEAGVDVVRSTPDQLPDAASLVSALVPPQKASALIPEEIKIHLGGVVDGRWNFKTGDPPLEEAALARCATKPVLMLIDEAHTLDTNVARVLLNLAQTLHNERRPFLLTLAGTPELERAFKNANSTFWERCETIGVSGLGPDAAIQAVAEPFGDRGIPIDPAVAARIPDITQNYPYFVATYGAALWKSLAREGSDHVSPHTAVAASAEYDRAVGIFYSRRRDELDEAGLLSAAGAVAGRFARKSTWDRARLLGAIRDVRDTGDPAGAFNGLRDLGFVWRPPGKDSYEAGIPSLMGYVLERDIG